MSKKELMILFYTEKNALHMVENKISFCSESYVRN